MAFHTDLQSLLEIEEHNTVGDSFGGTNGGETGSYSVPKVRDWILAQPLDGNTGIEQTLKNLKDAVPKRFYALAVCNLIRLSFLIELTNLKVGSTKMKTRWLPGYILMPQADSFEPIRGLFEPGNDQRSSSFDECLSIFQFCLNDLYNRCLSDPALIAKLEKLDGSSSFSYEFVYGHISSELPRAHLATNIGWIFNEDIQWLLEARPIIKPALPKQLDSKIKTKTYKTDRSLTGKDKTNRAKRWEVRSDDFQYATLPQCWSVERKLLAALSQFEGFPDGIKSLLLTKDLLQKNVEITRCSVTREILKYEVLLNDVVHGRAEYQVGHLHPLKRGGRHIGDNICWQSAAGNRIQGDMMIEEIIDLLKDIALRYTEGSQQQ